MDIYDNNNIDSNKCSLMSMVWIDRGIILTLIYQLVKNYKSIVNKKIIINNPEYRSFLSILFPDLVFRKYDQHNKNNFYFNIRQIIKKQDIIIDYLVNYNDSVNTKKVSLIPWYDMNDPIIIYKYSNNNLPVYKTKDFIDNFSKYRRCTYDNQLWDAVIEYQIILRYTYFNQDFTFNYVLNLINRFLKGTYLVRKNDKKIYIMPNMINAILQPPMLQPPPLLQTNTTQQQIVQGDSTHGKSTHEISTQGDSTHEKLKKEHVAELECDMNLFTKAKKEYINDEIYKLLFSKIGNDLEIKESLEVILQRLIDYTDTAELTDELNNKIKYSITVIHELLDNYTINGQADKTPTQSIDTGVIDTNNSDEFSKIFIYKSYDLSVLKLGSNSNSLVLKKALRMAQLKFPKCEIDYININNNYDQSKIINILLDVINKKIETVNGIMKNKK
jgi:hypothetical protein